jgi:serine phosphatase RsbU (regulator of sigma subunit)
MFCDQKFSTTRISVVPGESLAIYTDGISEAEGPDETQYGTSAMDMEKALAIAAYLDPETW